MLMFFFLSYSYRILHVDVAVFNILHSLAMTLDDTDRLWAEQTSTAVGHSVLTLKFV